MANNFLSFSLIVINSGSSKETLKLHQIFCQEIEKLQKDDSSFGDHKVREWSANVKPNSRFSKKMRTCNVGTQHENKCLSVYKWQNYRSVIFLLNLHQLPRSVTRKKKWSPIKSEKRRRRRNKALKERKEKRKNSLVTIKMVKLPLNEN